MISKFFGFSNQGMGGWGFDDLDSIFGMSKISSTRKKKQKKKQDNGYGQ